MPPIDFKPLHSSPFKSTLSSAKQHRSRHTPYQSDEQVLATGENGWPEDISIADQIHPEDWSYLSEGGKNLLIRYTPEGNVSPTFATSNGCIALRMRKASRDESTQHQENEDADQFAHEVVLPLLGGDPSVLPFTLPVPFKDVKDRRVLETIASRIEIHRPQARRSADGINEDAPQIWAVEDLSAPLRLQDGKVKDVLSIEIKPKWGYLPTLPDDSPNHDIKTRYSRFRMHKVHKQAHNATLLSWKELHEMYDPLDLYSDQPERMSKAIQALYRDWKQTVGKTNNFRLFWNGEVVKPNNTELLEKVQAYLSAGLDSHKDELIPLLTHLLVDTLRAKTLDSGSVLSRLAHLQSTLDDTDVEGLSLNWQSLTEGPLGQVSASEHNHLTLEPTMQEMIAAIQEPADASLSPLRRKTIRFLIAASFKDCSIFVRCEPNMKTTTKLIDLDPKPVGKLANFEKTDKDIVKSFRKWLADQAE